jgi:ABC-2 type transport system permease protein
MFRRGSTPWLLARETRYRTVLFVRNGRAVFFTLFFPLFFLFLFNSLNKGSHLPPDIRHGELYTQFFTPGIGVFAVISACYTGLAMSTVLARDSLVLKRIRGTPLPPWIYLAGRIASMLVVSFASLVVMFSASVAAFGVKIPLSRMPGIATTVVIGGACFCALGLAVTSLVSTAESAPAVVNFTVFPVLFISNIFFPLENAPSWLRALGWMFPIKHFAAAMQDAFDLGLKTKGFSWGHLAAVGAWFFAGLFLALRYFSWEPKLPEMTVGRRARRHAAAAR